MKYILLASLSMMPLTGSAASLSDILKENKLGIAAVGCAGLACYFHQNRANQKHETREINSNEANDFLNNNKEWTLDVNNILTGKKVIIVKDQSSTRCYEGARNLSLICSSIFASLAILKYMRK